MNKSLVSDHQGAAGLPCEGNRLGADGDSSADYAFMDSCHPMGHENSRGRAGVWSTDPDPDKAKEQTKEGANSKLRQKAQCRNVLCGTMCKVYFENITCTVQPIFMFLLRVRAKILM